MEDFFEARNERLNNAGFFGDHTALYPEVNGTTLKMYNHVRADFLKRYRARQRYRGFFLSGGLGIGKTSFLALIADMLLVNDIKAEFTTTSELIQKRKDDRYTNRKITAQALFLDDLGWVVQYENEINYIVTIIRKRYTMNLPTFIASNLDLATLSELKNKSNFKAQYEQLISFFSDANKYMNLYSSGEAIRPLNNGEIKKPDLEKSVLNVLDNRLKNKAARIYAKTKQYPAQNSKIEPSDSFKAMILIHARLNGEYKDSDTLNIQTVAEMYEVLEHMGKLSESAKKTALREFNEKRV